ncbi:uncharacterized protein SCHCODRAFT_02630437 [Schizophyllum commune H4-8]|uniref:uncharacterized protein n=1 Tax=Schizophyllum commune (strain H4-8 / FGSC 9210) TaxID=578458 RepID=UPI00215E979B|nr:uncharacterized protein SCHCODRAFT_02630437 [Schizophyllum commune H4-8]KAI5889938.1 hypothetical protein SCHCODRAFT_02630437 [Schizophyllum commune H4-8]
MPVSVSKSQAQAAGAVVQRARPSGAGDSPTPALSLADQSGLGADQGASGTSGPEPRMPLAGMLKSRAVVR